MLRNLLAILLIATTAAAAQSSEQPPAPPVTPPIQHPSSTWLDPDNVLHYGHLDIVTADHPTSRHSCLIHNVTPDSITCAAEHHHPEAVYERDNILAIIEPPNHQTRYDILSFVAIAAVALAASFFVPLAASITLRIVSGICLYALAWDDSDSDHNNDRILYQRPNTTLTLKLHS